LNSAKAFKPSASRSSGFVALSTVSIMALTASLVSGCKPMPGPRAMALAVAMCVFKADTLLTFKCVPSSFMVIKCGYIVDL
jgi:hypothetical protein